MRPFRPTKRPNRNPHRLFSLHPLNQSNKSEAGWQSPSLQRLPERPYRTVPGGILRKFHRRLSQFPLSILGVCPTVTFLLRRTIRDHLRRSRPEKILTVFQRIHLRFFRACGLASGRTSFASSRRQCRTGSCHSRWAPRSSGELRSRLCHPAKEIHNPYKK